MTPPEPRADEDQLLRRMRELETRVAFLEHRLDIASGPHPLESTLVAAGPARTAWAESVSAVPALGLSILGLAGAYILRALTESSALPPTVGIFAAIIYAALWLVGAARTPGSRRAEVVLYSLTAALVLGPLLWESTLRFRAISTGTAAAILLAFTLFGLIISWRKNLLIVATIATLAGVLTAASLLVGSHDVIPFTFLLLAIAAAVEISACLDHWLSERWLTAAAADLAVLLATYLVTNSGGLPASYIPFSHSGLVASQMALPGIYFSSILVRTLLRGSAFSFFEIGQLTIAFLLAVGGGLRLGADTRMVPAAAAVCLGCGASCYAAAFVSHGRNFRAYAMFGFLLIITATRIALPAPWPAVAWSGLAVISMSLASPLFRWQGCGYLVLSVLASGALAQATNILLGASDTHAAILPLLAGTGIALVAYFLAGRVKPGQQLLRTILGGIAFWPAAGVAAVAFAAGYHAIFGAFAPQAYCATLRTVVLAAGAVLLAWLASRRQETAFAPLIYLVMTLGAYRLLVIDLRQDHKTALVFSLLAYGAALMLLPRLIAPRQTAAR
jgi:hypothetical protein